MTHWVCKADGRIQCQNNPEIPLAVMRLELAWLVGGANILSEKKIAVIVPDLCGIPAGTFNAFEITEDGYHMLFHGFPGPNGFRDCPDAGKPVMPGLTDKDMPEPHFAAGVALTGISSATQSPVLVRELIGHRLRVYPQGSPITMDYVPDRVNIVTKGHHIADIWYG